MTRVFHFLGSMSWSYPSGNSKGGCWYVEFTHRKDGPVLDDQRLEVLAGSQDSFCRFCRSFGLSLVHSLPKLHGHPHALVVLKGCWTMLKKTWPVGQLWPFWDCQRARPPFGLHPFSQSPDVSREVMLETSVTSSTSVSSMKSMRLEDGEEVQDHERYAIVLGHGEGVLPNSPKAETTNCDVPEKGWYKQHIP